MRIDGRFDPKQWIKPQGEEVVVSARIDVQPEETEKAFASESAESEADFAGEVHKGYAYIRASRTAEAVTGTLEQTPDL